MPQPAPRGSQLDTFEPAIRDLPARYPDITAQRILEELRGHGYTGGYTVLSQRVRQLRPRPTIAPVRRFETAPGQQAQMDYSTYDLDFSDEGRRRVHAFSYVLGYSRRQYLYYLPTYSPELKRTEPMFRQVKYQEISVRSYLSKVSLRQVVEHGFDSNAQKLGRKSGKQLRPAA